MKRLVLGAWLLTAMIWLSPLPAQSASYHSNSSLEQTLRRIAGSGRGLFSLTELAKDVSGRPVWMVQAGEGKDSMPAVLVVAGMDGRHLVGTEMALAVLEELAGNPEAARGMLGGGALYVVPRLTPYGVEAFFDPRLRREVGAAEGAGDHDRDGLTGEDPCEDLNGDGIITLVRVRDPEGTYVLDGKANDFVRPAKTVEGERGEWRVLIEGGDDDGDELWNEEEDGGVHLARNFTHNYPWFERGVGAHQVSEAETRALADFVAAHTNIAAVVVFGLEDNLLTPPSDKETSDPEIRGSRFGREPVNKPNKDDLPYLLHMAKLYREDLGLLEETELAGGGPGVTLDAVSGGPTTAPAEVKKGGFAEYIYFTRGLTVLATPVWTPALQMALEKKTQEEEKKKSGEEAKQAEDKRPEMARKPVDADVQKEEAFRDWLIDEDPAAWIAWKPFTHPDFAGQEAYAGGFAPFAKINPPASTLETLKPAHTRLVTRLFEQLPRVRIRKASLEALGNGAFALTVTAENTGFLPDVLAQGVFAARVRDTRIEVTLPRQGDVLGGAPFVRLDRLAGSGGAEEVRLVLRLPGRSPTVEVELISELGGRDRVALRSGETVEGR